MPLQARKLVEEWQNDCAEARAQAIIGSIAVNDVEVVVINGLLPPALLLDTVNRVRNCFSEMLPAGLNAQTIFAGADHPLSGMQNYGGRCSRGRA